MALQQDYKLADYFSVIGLDEQLRQLESSPEDNLIEKVEIILMPNPTVKLDYNAQKEKWIDLDGTGQMYIRVVYGTHRPITDINFYRIKYYKGQPNRMCIPASMEIEPVPIREFGDPDADKKFKKTKKQNLHGDKKKDVFNFYGNFDLTPYLENSNGLASASQTATNLCFCFSRKKQAMPISDVEIVVGQQSSENKPEDIEFNLPPNLKQVNYRLGKNIKDRLLCYKYRDFIKKSFEAKLIDRFPLEGKDRSYYAFPESLSSFCFPSGIQFTTQRSTPSYFSFILTDAEGQHIYGTALVFDEMLSSTLKDQLRANHVTQNIDNIYSQKAICILSHYAFMESFKEILKQIYRIHLSNTPVPIERYIVNIMEEIPVPDKGNILILHEIGNQKIPFYRPIDQYAPFSTKQDIEYLFRALDAEQVIDIFLALLLEKKVLLISEHKSLLTHAAIALISLLFPLCWKHVLIPILPKNMTDVLDAPVPFLIGIETFIIQEDYVEIPQEVYRVDLDNGSISLRDTKPKLPSKEFKILRQRLLKATEGIERPDPMLQQVDFAFNQIFVDPDENNFVFNEYEIRDAFLEFMSGLMSGYTKCLIAPDSTKDVFMDSRDFFDFKKFRTAKDALKNITLIYKLTETTLFANFIEARSFGKSDQDEQIMYFDELSKQKRTKKAPLLIKPFSEKKAVKSLTPYEDGLPASQGYKYQTFPKFDYTLFYQPRKVDNYNEDAGSLLKTLINNDQLQKMHDSEWARYLNEIIYVLWFQIFATTLPMYPAYSRELIYFARKLLEYIQRKLMPMREIEIIYRRLFESCGSCKLKDEILELFDEMKKSKIDPDKVTFGTYYQSFLLAKRHQTPGLQGDPNAQLAKKGSYLKYSPDDFQIKLKEFAVQKFDQEEAKLQQNPSIQRLSIGSNNMRTETESATDFIETQVESTRYSQVKLSQVLENSLYMEIDLECQQCEKILKEEELMSGFTKNLSAYVVRCPICKGSFVPRFTVYSEYKTDYLKGRDGLSVQMLSPITLYKEYINIIEQKGDQIIFSDVFLKDHKTIFWNMILYFKIMRLPTFMLDLDYSQLHTKVHVSQIKKFLPLDKKVPLSGMSVGPKPKLDSANLNKLGSEKSPNRKSSITRVAGNLYDAWRGGNKNQGISSAMSDAGAADNRTSLNSYNQPIDNDFDRKSVQSLQIQNVRKKEGSVKSGSGGGFGGGGPGSVVTSLSDLERIEKIMTTAQYANKSIVKYFSKHLEEFRREMQYSKEIILSDLATNGVSEAMSKHANLNIVQSPLIRNFSDWNKNTQQMTAESIIGAGGANTGTSKQQSSVSVNQVGSQGVANQSPSSHLHKINSQPTVMKSQFSFLSNANVNFLQQPPIPKKKSISDVVSNGQVNQKVEKQSNSALTVNRQLQSLQSQSSGGGSSSQLSTNLDLKRQKLINQMQNDEIDN